MYSWTDQSIGVEPDELQKGDYVLITESSGKVTSLTVTKITETGIEGYRDDYPQEVIIPLLEVRIRLIERLGVTAAVRTHSC